MNPPDDSFTPDDIHDQERTAGQRGLLLALVLVCIQIVVSLIVYPFLPPMVPSHWNAASQVDRSMPKLIACLLWPAIGLALALFLRFLPKLGPAVPDQRGVRSFLGILAPAVVLLMLVLQLLSFAVAFHIAVNVAMIIGIAVSCLFILIGNYMGKLRRNFWAGIRSPWALASDLVWERTHRFGSWAITLAGFVGLILSFIPTNLRIFGVVGSVLLAAAITYIYSYFVYKRYVDNEHRPLSPPFER